jgi:IS5 family transposase
LWAVVSHPQNLHDSKTLPEVLTHCQNSRGKAVKTGVCDRGYRGGQNGWRHANHFSCASAKTRQPLSTGQKAQALPAQGSHRAYHWSFKSDFRLARNFLKGISR